MKEILFIKKMFLSGLVFVFMSSVSDTLMAQNLDQLKLMKQFTGTWRANTGSDTAQVWDFKLYGSQAFVVEVTQMIKDKEIPVSFNSISYDPITSKFYGFTLLFGANYGTWIGSFTSEAKFQGDMLYNFNPQPIYGRLENTFLNPKEWIWTGYNNEGVKFLELHFVKIE